MPKFNANLTMLFNEQCPSSTASRPPRRPASRPWSSSSPTPSTRTRSSAARRHGLVQVLHNLPAGNWDAGERGIACHPDRVGEFRTASERAIEYATALGCRQLNCLAGIAPAGVADRRCCAHLRRQPALAAAELEEAGIRLLIEPINTFDIPGFYLNRTAQAIALIEEVGATQPVAAVRHLPHAAHGGRAGQHDRQKHLPKHRPHADRRQPGPQRAGQRRDQLRLPVPLHRPHRLRGLDRLRIQARRDAPRKAGLAQALGLVRIGALRRSPTTRHTRTLAAAPMTTILRPQKPDRIHRPGHHGRADGLPPAETAGHQLFVMAHAQQGARGARAARGHRVRWPAPTPTARGGEPGRHRHHHGARHARRREVLFGEAAWPPA
jgi:hydroxypyruvate isomerase